VLWIHGLGCNKCTLFVNENPELFFESKFDQMFNDCNFLIPDLLGHGKSDNSTNPEDYSMKY